jgi:alkylation response protein AidB-like acyl-CoA dehydrogenase
MAEFTMELNGEQKRVRDWLHGFAADVIRPAAAEWDEREETPWPVIQGAAKAGIYSLDFYVAFQLADMPTSVDAARLLVWRASWMAINGKPFTAAEGSMPKLFASGPRAVRG